MKRPTIALCAIMRDEMSHLKEFLASVEGCFDEIHLTDTGSVDGSKEFAKEHGMDIAKTPVYVKDFTWVDDFAAARNFSMDGVKTDFVMWMDLDDVLSSKEEFKTWRDNVMLLNDFWLAPYNYAYQDGKPIITFLRERVVRTSKKFAWEFFIHEGMIAKEPVKAQVATNWTINHQRTEEDYRKDYERNVSMLEKKSKTEDLPPRLQWYFGKELHDKGRFAEGYTWLDRVIDNPRLELHDRILCFEYLVRCCLQRFFAEQQHKPHHERDYRLVVKGLQLALMGIQLAPMRAEFYCLAGDCLIQQGKEVDALPLYSAAAACVKPNGPVPGFLFINHAAYDHVPRNAISMIKFKMGDLDGALALASETLRKYNHPDTKQLVEQYVNLKSRVVAHTDRLKVDTDEVVFSCIPNSHPYPFDEEIYESKGIGGSETALVEVAQWMKRITGKNIIVFNTREGRKTCRSGVEYRPAHEMYEYFSRYKPELHIAWRHNIKLTDSKTFLWCHDLFTPGAEVSSVYEKHLCLSAFHREYSHITQGIPYDKIHLTRNGVNRKRFAGDVKKDENKIIWPNSPDRGLDRAILIVEKAREMSGRDLSLHVFYGIDNLYKYGLKDLADKLKDMMSTRPWVKYHGNVDQWTLAKEMQSSVIWLYPADFIETYCITAIEAMYAGCFGLVREVGGLRDTVRPFHDKGWAKLLFMTADTEEERNEWATELVQALQRKPWEAIDMTEFDHSWQGVAEDFLKLAGISWKKESPQEIVAQL